MNPVRRAANQHLVISVWMFSACISNVGYVVAWNKFSRNQFAFMASTSDELWLSYTPNEQSLIEINNYWFRLYIKRRNNEFHTAYHLILLGQHLVELHHLKLAPSTVNRFRRNRCGFEQTHFVLLAIRIPVEDLFKSHKKHELNQSIKSCKL